MKTGSDLYEKINTRMNKGRYILGVLVDKSDPDAINFDCAELASWGVYQTGGFLYGCENNHGSPHTSDAYTGYWDRDAHKIGKIVPIDQAKATKGAFLLRVAGNGVVGHIVCSDGKGGTAEANSAKYGNINSHVDGRRWDYGILVPGFDFTEGIDVKPIVAPTNKIYRLTSPVMVSPSIGVIQRKLADLGYYKGVVDNIFGNGTFTAVRKFQNDKGLVADGEIGNKTATELRIII